jgi:hypothetical protein
MILIIGAAEDGLSSASLIHSSIFSGLINLFLLAGYDGNVNHTKKQGQKYSVLLNVVSWVYMTTAASIAGVIWMIS